MSDSLFEILKEDWVDLPKAFMQRDPAARSVWEIRFLYPGFKAVVLHRFAHGLYLRGWFFWARAISEWARSMTGIEIHPGAKLQGRVIIDHGMGVVIGETAEVASDVLIYQGVTLGGTGKATVGQRRHPKIGQGCVLGVGCKIIGAIELGFFVKVGAGAVVLKNVDNNETVVGIPAKSVHHESQII